MRATNPCDYQRVRGLVDARFNFSGERIVQAVRGMEREKKRKKSTLSAGAATVILRAEIYEQISFRIDFAGSMR
jgi:hypothetical protein